MAHFDMKRLCTPAKVYLALAVLSSLMALFRSVPMAAVASNLLFAAIWVMVLGYLCKHGLKMVSWALVLLPYVLLFLAASNIYHISGYQNSILQSLRLQGSII